MEDFTTYSRVDAGGATTSATVPAASPTEVHVLTYDASTSTFAECSVDANDSGTNDVQPFASAIDTDPVGDIIYFICMGQMSKLHVDTGTAGAGYVAGDVTWKYSKDGALVNLAGVSDGTGGFKTTGSQVVSFAIPTDWEPMEVNNIIGYVIACEFTGAGKTQSTVAKIDQVWRGGKLFVTPYRVRSTAINADEDTYIYKARNTGGNTELNDYFEITIDTFTRGTGAVVAYWAVTQGVDDLTAEDAATHSWLIFDFVDSATTASSFRIRQCYRGALTSTTLMTTIINRRYFVHVKYDPTVGDGGTLYAYIHYDRSTWTDPTKANASGSLALNTANKETYTYFGPTWSFDGGLTGIITAVTGEYYLDSTPASIFAESNVSFPIQWFQTETLEDFPDESEASPTAAGFTWAADANCALTLPHWPLEGSATHCASVEADVATDDDGYASHAITSTDCVKHIHRATICLGGAGTGDTPLAASKERICWGVTDGTYYAALTIQATAGGVYYPRIRSNATTGVTAQALYPIDDDTEYQTQFVFCAGGTGTTFVVHLYIKGGAYVEWTLVGSYGIISSSSGVAMDTFFIGNRWHATGGETISAGGRIYVKDYKQHDGWTCFSKLACGGVGEQTIVMTQRVSELHLADYGNSYMEVWSSETGGVEGGWTRQSVIAAAANIDQAWLWPIWDGTNWWFFSCYRTSTMYSTKVYKTTDLTNLGDAVATFDDEWIFPSRMVESAGGHDHIIVGVDYKNIDGVGYPSSTTQIAKFAWFDLTDYTLDGLTTVNTANDITADLMQSEPFPYRRPSDSHMILISRREPASSASRDEYFHVATDADGAAWPALAAIYPGNDWKNINASIRALVFRGFLWCMGRDSQNYPWQSLVMKVDPDTLNIVADRAWTDIHGSTLVWNAGNGDAAARNGQIGEFKIHITFDLGCSSFRTIGTGLLAAARRNMLLDNF